MPKIISELVDVEGGTATGLSVQWAEGQFVFIIAKNGVVACGALNVEVLEEFNQVIAVAEGTPENPLVMPEDLLDAEITDLTEKAADLGIREGMTGRKALEILLKS